MKSVLASVAAGVLFGIGLFVAGMADREKVIAFLDVTGSWDPSLAIVLVTGVAVHAIGRALVTRSRAKPLYAPAFPVPSHTRVDRHLVLGSAIFGIGWGLVGLCPGPAILASAGGVIEALLFLPAMLAGILLHAAWAARVRNSDEIV